jgi:hypothetical protein
MINTKTPSRFLRESNTVEYYSSKPAKQLFHFYVALSSLEEEGLLHPDDANCICFGK